MLTNVIPLLLLSLAASERLTSTGFLLTRHSTSAPQQTTESNVDSKKRNPVVAVNVTKKKRDPNAFDKTDKFYFVTVKSEGVVRKEGIACFDCSKEFDESFCSSVSYGCQNCSLSTYSKNGVQWIEQYCNGDRGVSPSYAPCSSGEYSDCRHTICHQARCNTNTASIAGASLWIIIMLLPAVS